jgi:hypothetical protein
MDAVAPPGVVSTRRRLEADVQVEVALIVEGMEDALEVAGLVRFDEVPVRVVAAVGGIERRRADRLRAEALVGPREDASLGAGVVDFVPCPGSA